MGEGLKVLFIGDIVGRPGRNAVVRCLPRLVSEHAPALVIANCENAAGGFGVTPDIATELLDYGIDVLTSGNHVWDKKEIYDYISGSSRLIRPANYPEGAPGSGAIVADAGAARVAVVNLSGRVFMGDLDCPFRAARSIVEGLRRETPVVIVDFHAETTSEKMALGWYLDGTVSAVIGTHTHVQTSDERVLPGGAAYITDAGMTGPMDSVIGMRRETVIERFLTGMPTRFEVASKGVELQGVLLTIDPAGGKALSIERIKERVD